jgi:hypothetical protein
VLPGTSLAGWQTDVTTPKWGSDRQPVSASRTPRPIAASRHPRTRLRVASGNFATTSCSRRSLAPIIFRARSAAVAQRVLVFLVSSSSSSLGVPRLVVVVSSMTPVPLERGEQI